MGTGRRGPMVTLFVSGSLLLSILCLFPGPVTMAQLNPTHVELTISPYEGHVDMGPGGNNSVMFIGTVSVTTLPIVVTTVNINVTAGDWINETDQSNFVITGNREAEFEIYVYAPFNATSDDEETVKVRASWTTSLSEQGTEDATAIAVVDQFYRVNVYAPQTYRSGKPGEKFTMSAYVSNTGNGDDSFSIKLTNITSMEANGWSFGLEEDRVFLEADEKQDIKIEISIPSNAPEDLFTFYFNATSENGEVGVYTSDEVAIRIRVKDDSTNGGNGGNGNGGDGDDKPRTWCTTELIPVFTILPLGASMFGVRFLRGRRPRIG